MTRRKGEIDGPKILRAYPFHVRFANEFEDMLRAAHFYSSAAPRSVRQRGYVLVCFAEEADARAYMRHAGGELVTREGKP